MRDWIENLIDTEMGFESEVKGFPLGDEVVKFYVVRVGTDAYPCSDADIEAVQKAMIMASASFDEMRGLAKCIVVPHTIDIHEMDVEIKTRIKS